MEMWMFRQLFYYLLLISVFLGMLNMLLCIFQHFDFKILKFGTFSIRHKKSRIGRNPLTKEKKRISDRNVVLFKASKEFKDQVNLKNDS